MRLLRYFVPAAARLSLHVRNVPPVVTGRNLRWLSGLGDTGYSMSAGRHPALRTLEAERAAVPPQHIQAEQSVLGGLLLDNSAWQRLADLITGQDFYRADHRAIFQHIGELIESGKPADALTVAEGLERSGKLAEVGGQAYLASLAANTPSAANIVRYAEIVRERAIMRSLAALGLEIHEQALSTSADVEALKRDAMKRLEAVRPLRSQSTYLDWAELAQRQPPGREWVVEHWIPRNHTALLVGVGGAGKSTLAQQLACAAALGRYFVDKPGTPVFTLGWFCEDDVDEVWRRQVSIAQWLDVSLDAFEGKFNAESRSGMDNTLFEEVHGKLTFTPLLDRLREQVADTGAQLFIADNLAQIYGANENDRHQVTSFINGLAGALPGCTVLLLGHPSRQGGSEFSGSSAWENAVRTRFYLGHRLPGEKADDDEPPAETVRFLAKRKANYSAKDWRRLEFKDGVLVPDAPETAGGIVGYAREQAAERAVIEGLTRLQGMQIRATEGSRSPQYLPRLLADYKLINGCTKSEAATAMRKLLMAGRLQRIEMGRYGANRTPMFGLSVAEQPAQLPAQMAHE